MKNFTCWFLLSYSEDEIIQFSTEKMANFKAPRGITFVHELPKTALGKIQKAVIRKDFWKGSGRMVN
ncbi:AMP-binding enzyme [Bacillus salacetis]|uniref:AMP-binding enzyme n=1 Tax=Bacillus salacetis TaxID=2315464 RepID=UPI00109BB555|nr:hypothetical protein [Bacillus salacetis]